MFCQLGQVSLCLFQMHVVFCFFVFGCQFRGSQLPGKTRLRYDPLLSSGTLKPTHSLTHSPVLYVCCDFISMAKCVK